MAFNQTLKGPIQLLCLLWLITWASFGQAELLQAQTQSITQYSYIDAKLEPVFESTIAAQTASIVSEIKFDVADAVQQGDLLLVLDDTEQQAGVAQAEADLAKTQAQDEQAQLLLQRHQRLHQQGTLSKDEYDGTLAAAKSAKASVNAAKARLAQARQQLSYTRIRAPYAGIVKAVHVDLGERVAPGQSLMSGFAPTPLRAVADVPQFLATPPLKVEIISPQGRVAASHSVLFPYANADHHSVRLRAQLPESLSLMPGSWVKLAIAQGQRQALLVPSSAVFQRGEIQGVFVLDQDQTVLRQVRIGEHHVLNNEAWFEINAGLSPGDTFHSDAYAFLASLGEQP